MAKQQQFVTPVLPDTKPLHINIEPFTNELWPFYCYRELIHQTGLLHYDCTKDNLDSYQDILKKLRLKNKSIITFGHFTGQFQKQFPELKDSKLVTKNVIDSAVAEMIERDFTLPDINFLAYEPENYPVRRKNHPYDHELIIHSIYDAFGIPFEKGENAISFTIKKEGRNGKKYQSTTKSLIHQIRERC